jgi:hypothetical protein
MKDTVRINKVSIKNKRYDDLLDGLRLSLKGYKVT